MKTLGDMIRTTLVSCEPTDSVLAVARRMREHRLGALPVLEGEALVGVVTEGDLLAKVVAEDRRGSDLRVSEVMTKSPMTAPPGMHVDDAADFLRRRGFRRLPVVQDGRVLGLVSLRDLFDAEAHDMMDENYRLKMLMMQGD